MSRFYKMWTKATESVLNQYFNAADQAEKNRFKEHNAAIKIVAVWRAHRVRRDVRTQRAAAINIQRVFRGYKGRVIAHEAFLEKQKRERRQFFDSCAVKIQKIWKGYRARKDFDYYARKKYLKAVAERNEQIRKELAELHAKEEELMMEEKMLKNEEKFKKETAKLHYLLSTTSTPGIFSPSREKMASVTVNNQTIEAHIKANGRKKPKNVKVKYTITETRTIDITEIHPRSSLLHGTDKELSLPLISKQSKVKTLS